MELKLQMELIPETSHYKNLRNDVGPTKWGKIRKTINVRQNGKCAICDDEPKRLYCHEIWDYDGNTKVQKLVGFMSVCGNCNLCIHFGFARLQAEKGLIKIDDIINHFLKVNNCTMSDFEKHKKEEGIKYRDRSEIEWQLDYDGYELLI